MTISIQPESNRIINLSGAFNANHHRPTEFFAKMAETEKTVKIRVQGAIEAKTRATAAKANKRANLALLSLKLRAYKSLFATLAVKIGELETQIDPQEQFAKKLTEKEAFDLMLQLPYDVKNNPTIIGVQKVYKELSRRQAIKIWQAAHDRKEKIAA